MDKITLTCSLSDLTTKTTKLQCVGSPTRVYFKAVSAKVGFSIQDAHGIT